MRLWTVAEDTFLVNILQFSQNRHFRAQQEVREGVLPDGGLNCCSSAPTAQTILPTLTCRADTEWGTSGLLEKLLGLVNTHRNHYRSFFPRPFILAHLRPEWPEKKELNTVLFCWPWISVQQMMSPLPDSQLSRALENTYAPAIVSTPCLASCWLTAVLKPLLKSNRSTFWCVMMEGVIILSGVTRRPEYFH